MKHCKCDGKYLALELGFIVWYRGFYHIVEKERKMRISHCPFCGSKLNLDKVGVNSV